MQVTWFLTSRSLVLSIVLHIVLGGVFIFSFEFSPKPAPVIKPAVNIIKAAWIAVRTVKAAAQYLRQSAARPRNKPRIRCLERRRWVFRTQDWCLPWIANLGPEYFVVAILPRRLIFSARRIKNPFVTPKHSQVTCARLRAACVGCYPEWNLATFSSSPSISSALIR